MLQFDTSAIFERIGGPAALRRALAEDNQGLSPSEATVQMWKSRNRISQPWMGACVYAVLSRTPEPVFHLFTDVPDALEDPF
jgi:hypothetical protein